MKQSRERARRRKPIERAGRVERGSSPPGESRSRCEGSTNHPRPRGERAPAARRARALQCQLGPRSTVNRAASAVAASSSPDPAAQRRAHAETPFELARRCSRVQRRPHCVVAQHRRTGGTVGERAGRRRPPPHLSLPLVPQRGPPAACQARRPHLPLLSSRPRGADVASAPLPFPPPRRSPRLTLATPSGSAVSPYRAPRPAIKPELYVPSRCAAARAGTRGSPRSRSHVSADLLALESSSSRILLPWRLSPRSANPSSRCRRRMGRRGLSQSRPSRTWALLARSPLCPRSPQLSRLSRPPLAAYLFDTSTLYSLDRP